MKGGGNYLRLCDRCCDASGTAKEMTKSGGCTCDVCGWACACCRDKGRQMVNRIPVAIIPEEGWPVLQKRNERSLAPIDWEQLFANH